MQLLDLAQKLDVSVEELILRVRDLGFDIEDNDSEIDDDLAELVEDEIGKDKSEGELVGEEIEEQLEREIVRKQRKQTAASQKHLEKSAKQEEKVQQITVDHLEVPDVISVKEFSEKIGINAARVIGELMRNGILANINQQIDFDTASVIADTFGVKLKKKRAQAEFKEILERDLTSLLGADDAEDLVERPPVISVMGHVDHGKTSLLDAIRNANVVSTESGGITQHIGAYQVVKNGKKITFIDTPGHEAFTAMRARGAKATDIAILVVAADDGVRPQTIEAINHARDAGTPIVVAINKIDKEGANLDRVRGELAEHGLTPEDWGGTTIMVPVSAIKGTGIPELLESLLLVSEVEELRANPSRPGIATVIEAHLDPGLGPVATVIINTGTLKVGDAFVVGDAYGKVKTMHDHNGKSLKKVVPSSAVKIAGISKVPLAGDVLQVFEDERYARDQASKIAVIRKTQSLDAKARGMEQIVAQIQSGELKTLKLIIKADTDGSLEAIRQSIAKIESTEVAARIIHSGIGGVTETDVMMAAAGDALILAFHVGYDSNVAKLAEREGIEIKEYSIIYSLLEDIKSVLSGLLTPEKVEVVHGKAKVLQIFLTKKKEQIVGLLITNGKFAKNDKIRAFRSGELIGEGEIVSIQRVDKQVDEIKEGNECGIKFIGKFNLEPEDILESYVIEERIRTLET